MANFLYVFRGGGMGLQKLSPQEMQQQMQKWVGWVNDLRNKGHLKAGDPLEASGKTVRGRKKAITDGPYAEAKDLVGGYLLIEAKDIEEAVKLSLDCPGLDVEGTVEVRPIAKM